MLRRTLGIPLRQGMCRSIAKTATRRRERPDCTWCSSSRRRSRFFSSLDESDALHRAGSLTTNPPTKEQLRAFFVSQAVPFVGFGLMDQTVMLQAGHAIDMSIGVTFGLSTLTAAALGQVCSDAAGVLFGGTMEAMAKAAGLPRSGMTAAQRALPHVRRVKVAGNLVGVVTGCVLGLLNFLVIDTERPSSLKLKAMSEEQEFAFEVEASNAQRDDATVFTVRGPDIDGVLASMTSALTATNCSLIELNAHRAKDDSGSNRMSASRISNHSHHRQHPHTIEDVFAVVQSGTNEKIPDDELDDVATIILEATNAPVNMHTFKAQVKEPEDHNATLRARMQKLEKQIYERQIKVRKTTKRGD